MRQLSHLRSGSRRNSARPTLEPLEDRIAPAVSLDIDSNSQIEPLTDGLLVLRHLFGFAGQPLVQDALGTEAQRTDPASIASFLESGRDTMLDADGNGQADPLTDGLLVLRYLFGFTGVALTEGALGIGATRTDPAVIISFLDGYRQANPFPIALTEINQLVTEATFAVPLGPVSGLRTIQIDFAANFDRTDTSATVEDQFLVYLVDPAHPNQTLLDRGTPGTALFALSGDSAEFTPGVVRYDGHTLEIDTSALTTPAEGLLVFQLLNTDSDQGSRIEIASITTGIEIDAVSPLQVETATTIVAAGPAVDWTGFTATADVQLEVSNVRFQSDTGRYQAELRLHNTGPALGRRLAVRFPGLPSGVQLVEPSGVDDEGVPYLSFLDAIHSGGLGTGYFSDSILLELSDPTLTPFSLRAEVLQGGANQAPQLQTVGPLAVTIGDVLEAQLIANDPDGDPVTFAVRGNGLLPNVTLTATGKLIVRPAPGQEGDYALTVVANDGALVTRQDVTLTVVADPVATTRISGQVLDVQGNPLAGVPISLSRITVMTDAQGRFTIELPALLVPTEAFDIIIPTGDPLFDPFNTGTQNISFFRAGFDATTGTSIDNPRLHPNLVTAFLDSNIIYGSDDFRAAALRTFSGGKLKANSTAVGELLPFNNSTFFPAGPLENDASGTTDPTSLFVAGDVRASENVALAALHTIFLREHNRLADEIAAANPGLSDEEIYQQARRLLTAILQQITYSEYLPLLLGPDALPAYTGYDPDVDPQTGTFFATAAFRLGHTQMVSQLLRLDADGEPTDGGPLTLREAFFTTAPITTSGIDSLVRGLIEQQAQEIDGKVVDELRSFLFGPPGAGGMDLPAMNIQRARDLGLPSYNQARSDFGLDPVTSFAEITSDTALQQALQTAYGTVDRVDAWVGAIAEDHVAGALLGPLLQSALAQQFQRTRDGDRFWYENGQFTVDELTVIRSTRLKDLIERNTGITGLPEFVLGTNSVTPPAPAGTTATGPVTEYRSIDGSGNHLTEPSHGQVGENLLIDSSLHYGDGISTPAGADRPNPRDISNTVLAQSGSIPNTGGATALAIFFGQILSHDLSLTATGITTTLAIHGDQAGGPDHTYPFVAEKLPLLLGHVVYPGVNNRINRPIYLPILDMANAVTVDPEHDLIVTTSNIPGVALNITAGNLKDRQGNLYTGQISITEVPTTLTPAALPANLIPDLVVTIQPAEMVFTTPAPISFPNRQGFVPGTKFDLWSIDPITGEFADVGDMEVSADGTQIVTISGGIRTSSWHAPGAQPTTPEDQTPQPDCGGEDRVPFNSEVELLSGTLLETHALAGYQSQGVYQGVTLRYDSQRANPSQVFRFSYDVVPATTPADALTPQALMLATVSVSGNGLRQELAGATVGTLSGAHFWNVGQSAPGDTLNAGLAMDLSTLQTGVYNYTLSTGFGRNQDNLSATMTSMEGAVVAVNSMDSPFGSGWGLAGLQEIVEGGTALQGKWANSVLLIDGEGSELLFLVHPVPGQTTYLSPMGDFSRLEKLPDGRFRRTMPDQTVYDFNEQNKLGSMTDRNGNVTRYEYDGEGHLMKIIDPVGLETQFTYENGMIKAITNPDGKATQFEHDAAGNLTRIMDPDQAERSFGYDNRHLLMSEITARGFTQQTQYDEFGKVNGAIREDGSTLRFTPVEASGLSSSRLIGNLNAPPAPERELKTAAQLVDGNGNVMQWNLDGMGFIQAARDGAGALYTLERDANHLVTKYVSGRGAVSTFTYDDRGNQLAQRDLVEVSEVGGDGAGSGLSFPGRSFGAGASPEGLATGDLNNDGMPDIVTANAGDGTLTLLLATTPGRYASSEISAGLGVRSVHLADVNGDDNLDLIFSLPPLDTVAVWLGDGLGGFGDRADYPVSPNPGGLAVGDLNLDGNLDLVTASTNESSVSILLGNGLGQFTDAGIYGTGTAPIAVAIGDVTGDNLPDLVTANNDSFNFSVLVGDGQGGVATTLPINLGSAQGTLTLGDVNGDGILDVITTTFLNGQSRITILRSLGNGQFAGPEFIEIDAALLHAVDLNGDGKSDLLAAEGSEVLHVLLNDGQGVFTQERDYLGGSSLYSLTTADMDADARVDVVIASQVANFSFDSQVTVLYSTDTGSLVAPRFQALPPELFGFTPGDFNEDGKSDLVALDSDTDTVVILIGNGQGQFVEVARLTAGADPITVTVHDLDQDANQDLVVVNNLSNTLSIFNGRGDGTFAAALNYAVDESPVFFDIGDLNGDGLPDLVVDGADNLSVLLNLGGGMFGPAAIVNALPGIVSLDLADFNEDERLDVLIRQETGGSIALLFGDGLGGFSAPQSVLPANLGVAIGDFNSDGHLDLVTAAITEAHLRLGDGQGGFADPVLIPGVSALDLFSADVNGDGKLDLLAPSPFAGVVTVLLGDGQGGFAPESFIAANNSYATFLADVDGNHSADLVVISASFGENAGIGVHFAGAGVGGTVPLAHRATFDPNFSQPTSSVDERGQVSTYDIDPTNGNIRSVSRPLGQSLTFGYRPDGQVERVTDSLGRRTDSVYDDQGRLVSITSAAGTADAGTVRYEYDDAGNQTAMIDENNERTEYEYDERNRLALVRDALGNETHYQYDPAGNIIAIRDARGNITTNEYDSRNRLIRTTDQQNHVATYEYDREGNLAAMTDPLGHTIRMRYDRRNRLVEQIDPDGGRTQYRYDLDDNLVALTDPVGNRTTFTYDSRNRLIRETDPLGKQILYGYDGADNLIGKIDRNGRRTNYVYDDLNRLSQEVWVGGNNTIDYSYDVVGNLLSVQDSFSALTYTYDDRNRVETVTNAGTPDAPTVALAYTYDLASNVLRVTDTINGAAGAVTSYQYDALDRLMRLTQSGSGLADKRVDFTYNPVGQYASVNRYNDLDGTQLVVGTTYQYDTLNRLTSLHHRNASGTDLAFFDYTYDDASRITSILDIDGLTTYDYDDRDQLTSANHADPDNPDESYAYDANGNRINSHLHGNGYQTGPGNRLLSDGTYNYEYDDEGNMTRRTNIATGDYREFAWDHRNRLVTVTDRTASNTIQQVVEFRYDTLDRRISKRYETAVDHVLTHFVYDREDVILDFVDPDGSPGSELTAWSQRYLHGVGIDEVLSQDGNTGSGLWLLFDHLGTIRTVVDSAGLYQHHFQYDSFGNLMNDTSFSPQLRFQFTGREYDTEINSLYFRSRYFDSLTGRFFSPDIVFIDPNLYRYVINTPTAFVDPFGFQLQPPYLNVAKATYEAGKQYYQKTLDTGREYGGWGIYDRRTGEYSSSEVRQSVPGPDGREMIQIPPIPFSPYDTTKDAGNWHTHPRRPDAVNQNNSFSPDDIKACESFDGFRKDWYLFTPDGHFLRHAYTGGGENLTEKYPKLFPRLYPKSK